MGRSARRVLALLLIALLAALPVAAQQGNEQTHFTVPAANATFLSDLRTFLYDESAARYADQFASFVVSGCIHGTVAGLTATPSACTAYPAGNYITETSAVTYSDNATCWLVGHRDTSGNSGNFTRVGTSHYLLDCIDATQPTVPTNGVFLLKVTTSAGSITAVLDLRVLTAPASALVTLTNKTGGPLVVGDVVAFDTTNDQAVALSDTLGSLAKFVVAVQSVASGAAGLFAYSGRALVKVTGVVTRGHYLQKSATTLAVEDTGTAMAAGTPTPAAAVGIALLSSTATAIVPVMVFEPASSASLPLSVGNGGTGLTGYATGDLIEATGAATLARLAAGTQGQVLQMGASLPGWALAYFTHQGRVTLSGVTLKYCPFQGNQTIVNSQLLTIPDACATVVVGGTLTEGGVPVASTTYFVYAFNNGGVVGIQLSATTHATQAGTGVEIRSGDATRSLVGMVRTTAGTAFADSATQRFTVSYFNRRAIGAVNNFTANRTTVSTTYVELNTEIRVEFVTWGDEAVAVGVNGLATNSITSTNFTAVGFDGTNQENAITSFTSTSAGVTYPVALSFTKNGLAEGYHYATVLGAVGANTGTWVGGAYAADTTVRTILSLALGIRG